MKKITALLSKIMVTIIIFINFSASAQVHVRGYYRKNGTYVQPHERTRPNHTITDNYSYPGNYNPNTHHINNGKNSILGNSEINHPYNSSGSKNYSSNDSLNNGRNYSRSYPYITKFDNPTILPPLRSSPSPNAPKIYTCSKSASVNVLEEIYNTGYCRVTVDGRTGYLSQALLRLPDISYVPTMPSTPIRSSAIYTGSLNPVSFQTRFDNPTINPPLRAYPTVEAEEIYRCPKTADVYVLGDVPNSIYCHVTVNGHTGFVSKSLLIRQP